MKMNKFLILLSVLSTKVFAEYCTIDDVLTQMEVDTEVQTVFELKEALREKFGGTYYKSVFYRYIEETNPYFKNDGELVFEHVKWAKDFVESSNFDNFKRAVHHVAINPKSNIPELDAKYAIGAELAKLDSVFLKGDYIQGVKVIATHDNVTTYWTHLDGVPVRGHQDGVTWNSIEGAGSPEGETELVIALKQNSEGKWVLPNGNHGSKNIVLHEYGHTFDKIMGKVITDNAKKFSADPEFYRAWYSDYVSGNFKESYYVQPGNNYEAGLEEAFAEGLAKYFAQDGVSYTEWPYISNYIRNSLIVKLSDRIIM